MSCYLVIQGRNFSILVKVLVSKKHHLLTTSLIPQHLTNLVNPWTKITFGMLIDLTIVYDLLFSLVCQTNRILLLRTSDCFAFHCNIQCDLSITVTQRTVRKWSLLTGGRYLEIDYELIWHLMTAICRLDYISLFALIFDRYFEFPLSPFVPFPR